MNNRAASGTQRARLTAMRESCVCVRRRDDVAEILLLRDRRAATAAGKLEGTACHAFMRALEAMGLTLSSARISGVNVARCVLEGCAPRLAHYCDCTPWMDRRTRPCPRPT